MPNEKLAYYEALAADTARRVIRSIDDWGAFLQTAARLVELDMVLNLDKNRGNQEPERKRKQHEEVR